MQLEMFDTHTEILTKGALRSLNDGVAVLRLESELKQLPRVPLLILVLFNALTIASARHHVEVVDSAEHFIQCLGYCQLDAYFRL